MYVFALIPRMRSTCYLRESVSMSPAVASSGDSSPTQNQTMHWLVWRILPKSPSIWRHNCVAQVYSSRRYYTWSCTNSERIQGSLYITMKQSYIPSVKTIPYWRTALCKRGESKVCTKHILDVNHKLLKNIMWPPTALSGILLGYTGQVSARRSRSTHDQSTDPKRSDTWNYYD